MLRTPIPNAGERREWPRYRAGAKMALSVEAVGKKHACALENLSLGGACLRFEEDGVPEAAKLSLRIPKVGVIRLQRRWQTERQLGVMFDYSNASLAFVQGCLEEMMDADGMPKVIA